jgi:hypothetical protein
MYSEASGSMLLQTHRMISGEFFISTIASISGRYFMQRWDRGQSTRTST